MPQHSLLPQAQQKVEEWTRGLTVVTRIHVDGTLFFVIAKDPEDKYEVQRYFGLGDNWAVSIDAREVTADEAFKVLAEHIG